MSLQPYLCFGIDPYLLKGKTLINRHTGLENNVADVCRGFYDKPMIYIGAGTVHDCWSIENIEKHYYPLMDV